jgi:hypothetical protein
MSKYAEGFRTAIGCARQIDIHWTEDERCEMLNRAIADQEHVRREHPEDTDEISEGAGFIAGLKSRLTTPREDGHDWNPARPGCNCQTCEEQ